METFGPPRDLVADPEFVPARTAAVSGLDLLHIDGPIRDLIAGLARLPHCFTLQCCHGHFVCGPDDGPDNDNPIPVGLTGRVRYRIAYVALCLEVSGRGRACRAALARLPALAPGFVQFGSPDWFWQQRVNTYALQVEPSAWQLHDGAQLEVAEARRVERVRDLFFARLAELVAAEVQAGERGRPGAAS